jgi:uncharacterized protein (DUF58 family)
VPRVVRPLPLGNGRSQVSGRGALTARGAVALAVVPVGVVPGLLTGAEELVLLSIALFTLLLCGLGQSAWRGRRARGNWRVTVQLDTSDAEVGRELAAFVTLTAAGRGGSVPLWLENPTRCWERVGHHGPEERRRMPLANPALSLRVPLLVSGATVRFRSLAPTERRGVFVLQGCRLWCFDSLGFFSQLVGMGPSATITVHPVPVAVELADDMLVGEPGTGDTLSTVPRASRRQDSLGDFSGIRPYVPGDRLRLLYWPALARTGDLMVRHFDDTGPHRVHLLADLRPLVGEHGGEAVLATAAGLGLRILAHGSTVELSTSAGQRIAIGPGPHGDIALLRAIAAVNGPPAPLSPRRWMRRRNRSTAPASGTDERSVMAVPGAPLVITTRNGADALPVLWGTSHVVIAT